MGTPTATAVATIEEATTVELAVAPFVAARLGLGYAEARRFEQEAETTTTYGRAHGVEHVHAGDPSAWGDLPAEIHTGCDEPQRWPVAITATEGETTFRLEVGTVDRAVCDSCVLDEWDLDIDTFEASMKARFAREGADTSQFGITGSGTMTFRADGTFSGTRDVRFTGAFGRCRSAGCPTAASTRPTASCRPCPVRTAPRSRSTTSAPSATSSSSPPRSATSATSADRRNRTRVTAPPDAERPPPVTPDA